MNVTREIRELLFKIRLGEDSEIELKAVELGGDKVKGPHPAGLSDEIAAFANSNGGTLVLGVDDKRREVTGIPPAALDRVEAFVRQLCIDRIEPELPVRIVRLELPDRAGNQHPVLKVEIPRSLFVHRSANGYFRRIGSARKEMPPEALARLFQQRSQARLIRFDEQTVPGATLDQADPGRYGRFLRDPADPPTGILRKLNLLRDDDEGRSLLTVSGVLLIAARPQQWLASAYIQCVAYSGRERYADDQRDARDCEGPLDEQIACAFEFVKRNMRIEAIKAPGRIDLPQFSPAAVFEAIVNAVAHRDYSLAGSRIRLHLFDDRLELSSPGALPNSLTVETLSTLTATRNEALTNLLGRYYRAEPESGRQHLIERRGEGVPTILREGERLAGRLPRYEMIGDQELKLTLWAADKEHVRRRQAADHSDAND